MQKLSESLMTDDCSCNYGVHFEGIFPGVYYSWKLPSNCLLYIIYYGQKYVRVQK